MHLADFIDANVELILAEWEIFARQIWPSDLSDSVPHPAALRDDAEDILRATVLDMCSKQTLLQQSDKSKGESSDGTSAERVNKASETHGVGRAGSGFELWAVVAEYRALRASVLRLWRESSPTPSLRDIDDVTRFNECIDQSLTEAVRSYTARVKQDRDTLLRNEQAARGDAESANRAKDVFLATLSHELRTPLNAIVGWVSILRMGGFDESRLAEGLDVIERNTKSQVHLIDEILDVSRIVSGKLRLEIANCDLIQTINAGIEVARPAADAREIRLDVHLDPAARYATCDATRIQQIIWNLLSNAIKFSRKGGAIKVVLDRDRSTVRINISDDGQGIDPDVLPYIFDRFRQADGSTRRTHGGLGLGLSIVKHLAEMHGGSVEALSAGEGQGATFIVDLPTKAVPMDIEGVDTQQVSVQRNDRRTSPPSAPNPALVRLDGIHVLVVDDETDARQMLLLVLEHVGARVTTAGSAREALALLADYIAKKQIGPDILLSDVAMPGQNGYDLIREARRNGYPVEKLPAIAVTAFSHIDDAREAQRAGFQVHVPKPVNLYELTTEIARLMAPQLNRTA